MSGNDERTITPICFGVGKDKRVDECKRCDLWRDCIDVMIGKLGSDTFIKMLIEVELVKMFEREQREISQKT